MNFDVFGLDLRLDDNDDADCGWWRKLYFSPWGLRAEPDLLKFATMMGMGSVMQSTPQMAHSEATSFPGESNQIISYNDARVRPADVLGEMSP